MTMPKEFENMKRIADVKVGDRVLLTVPHSRSNLMREAEVTKIGRENIYVDVLYKGNRGFRSAHKNGFDRKTGREKNRGAPAPARILTADELAFEAIVADAQRRIREHGFSFMRGGIKGEQIIEIADALTRILGTKGIEP